MKSGKTVREKRGKKQSKISDTARPVRTRRTPDVKINRQPGSQKKLGGQGGYANLWLERISDGVVAFDQKMNYTYVNEHGGALLGRKPADLIGKNYWEEYPEAMGTSFANAYVQALETQTPVTFEDYYAPWDRWFENRIYPSGDGIIIFFNEVTERKRAERQIAQMSRLYATLSQVNQTIVRVKDRRELYQSICNVAVQFGKFSLAWIGLLDQTSGDVRPVAANGLDITKWPFPTVNIHRGELKDGLIATAIRTSRVVTSDDVQIGARLKNLYDHVQEYAHHSSAAVPFRIGGVTIGVLSLACAENVLFKSEQEIHLLEEMGLDISFALDTMKIEAERRQAELDLQVAERDYRSIFENAPVGIFQSSPEGRYLKVNAAMAKIYGYDSPQDMLQSITNISQQIHLDVSSRQRFQSLLNEQGEVIDFEAQNLRRDGSVIWTSTNARVVINGVGQIICYEGFVRDITERKSVETALHESEERFSKAFHANPVGLNIFRLSDNRSVDANNAFLEINGYSREELMGRSAAELNVFIDINDREEKVAQLHESGEITNWETKIRRKSGEIRDVLISIYSISIGGQQMGMTVMVDITERKQAEKALQESEKRYHTIFENSPVFLLEEDYFEAKAFLGDLQKKGIWDFKSYFREHPEEGRRCVNLIRIVNANKSARDWYHIQDVSELSGAMEQLIGPEAVDGILEELFQLVDNGSHFERDTQHLGPEHQPAYLAIRGIVAPGYEDTWGRVLISILDFTDRKKVEMELKRYADNISTMYELSGQILTSLNLEQICESTHQAVRKLMSCDSFVVALLDEETQEIEDVYLWDHDRRWPAGRRSFGQGLTGYVISSGKPLLVVQWDESYARMTGSTSFGDTERSAQSVLCVPLLRKDGTCFGMISTQSYSSNVYTVEHEQLLITLVNQVSEAFANVQLVEDLQRSNAELYAAYDATIEGWSRAMDLRDKETEGHTQRVTDLVLRLAYEMNIPESEMMHIRRGALLHDIGKLGVPDTILLKDENLSDAEWEIMRKHPTYALEMLSSVLYLRPALDIPYCHHEKWDGTGYPQGLKGEQIPLTARIFTVVDVWDALTSSRPYRGPWSREQALEYIKEQSGKHFDPQVAEAFLKLIAGDENIS